MTNVYNINDLMKSSLSAAAMIEGVKEVIIIRIKYAYINVTKCDGHTLYPSSHRLSSLLQQTQGICSRQLSYKRR